MKRLLILICALGLAASAPAAPRTAAMRQAVADVRTAIDRAEHLALERQSLEELHAAAREQVVRELKLTREQRKRFDPLYDALGVVEAADLLGRQHLGEAVDVVALDLGRGRDVLQFVLQAAALRRLVARRGVGRLGLHGLGQRPAVGIEGQIATSIKRATGGKHSSREVVRIKGKGLRATQEWGAAGEYTGIVAPSYFRITVSPSARTITVTADQRLIDYLSLERTDGVLRFRRNAEIRAEGADIAVDVTVPASKALRSLTAGSYGSIDCPVALRGATAEVSVQSYGRVKADLAPAGRATVNVSSYGKFEGTVTCDACEYKLSSYGSATGAVACRTQGSMTIGSYARFSDPVKAPALGLSVASGASMSGALECEQLRLTVSSYAKVDGAIRAVDAEATLSSNASLHGDVKCRTLTLGLSSYAKFTGSAECRELRLTVQSSASFDAKLAAERFEAFVGSYGKARIQGDADVAKGAVKLASNATFSAPSLRVADYTIDAWSHYSKADVWCSGTLRIETSTTAQVTYDGPCRVEAMPGNVRRK